MDFTPKNQFAMKITGLSPFNPAKWKSKADIPPQFCRHEQPIFRHLLWRRACNMNTILLIVGGVRTGKSYAGLKISEKYSKLVGKPYDVQKQCSFDIKPCLEWSIANNDNVFMLDEVGVSLNPQEWYTNQAKIFRNFTQTQGFRGNLLILVLPNVAFLLKAVRFMCNYVIATRSQGSAVLYKLVMNHVLGKVYPMPIGGMKISLPSPATIAAYEHIKQPWNDAKLRVDLNDLDGNAGKRTETTEKYDPWAGMRPEI